jgi:thioredoxin 1
VIIKKILERVEMTTPDEIIEKLAEAEVSSEPMITPMNLGKLSILTGVIGIVLKLGGDAAFEEHTSSAIMVNIAAALIVGGGISAGMYGLIRACKCFSIDMLLLAGIGIFLNGGLFAMGFVKLPMPGQFNMGPGKFSAITTNVGPKSVSAKEMNVQPISGKGGPRIITQDWTAGYPYEVSDKNFDELVNHADTPVLVDFWAPWCGPCRMMGPVIEQLAAKYEGKVKIYKLNVDIGKETAASFKIRGIPTIILFKNGQIKTKWVGVTSEQEISSAIDKLL